MKSVLELKKEKRTHDGYSEMLEALKPTLSAPMQSAGAAALYPLTLTDLRKAGSVIGWRQETMGGSNGGGGAGH